MEVSEQMTGKKNNSIVIYLCLIVLALLFSSPLIWLLSTSLKDPSELFQVPTRFLPETFRWDNYLKVFETIHFFRLTANTFIIAISSMIGILITSPMVAYALSHVEWKGKKLLFVIVLSTMLLPYQVTMIPLYITWNKAGFIGTYWPLIAPAFLSAGAGYYIFLLRQFFMTLPHSLVQAARIDGASELRIYVQIILPMCKPVLITIAIFSFLFSWSDFLGPLLYLNDQSMYTLTLGLYAFMQTHYVEWELIMAASAMFTLPIIILFFFAQKQFVEGINLTGIKG